MKKVNIPHGTDKDSVYARKEIIGTMLARLIGTSVPCPALGEGKKVEFLFKSIDETATRAAKSYESTCGALRVVEAIKKATYVKEDIPRSRNQEKMNFIKVHELKAILSNIGEVKIIVGERKNTRILHYCITKKQG